MQIRKLVKSGLSSLVVALPMEWLKKNKLKAGDMIYLNEMGSELTIKSEREHEPDSRKDILINVDGKSLKSVTHEIISAYLENCIHINIRGKELKNILKTVKATINDLVALELVEESSELIVAKSFLNLYDSDLKVLIRRMDNIIRAMSSDLRDAPEDVLVASAIEDRDKDINRLSFLVIKILKAAYLDPKLAELLKLKGFDLLKYWEVNVHLEKIGDGIKKIAKLVPKLTSKELPKFLILLKEIEDLYLDVMNAFYNNSQIKSDLVSDKKDRLLEAIDKYIRMVNYTAANQIAINAYDTVKHINDIGRVVRYMK